MTTSKVGGSKVEKATTEPMNPQDLKTLFEALNISPGWLSKRFILKKYCGWSDEDINLNAQLRSDEENQSKIGNKTGAFR